MTRRILTMTVLLTVLTASLVATAQSGRVADNATVGIPSFQPIMPIHNLMIEQERHFSAYLDLLRNQDDKERFRKMRHEALALAEMANINGYQEKARQNPDYWQFAEDLKKQAIELADLAAKERIDEAKKVAIQINNTCKACHE